MMEVDSSNIKSLGDDPLLKPKTIQQNVNTSGSLATLLTQTVQSGNEKEICKVLHDCSHKAKVLETTVKRIPTTIIDTLLTILSRELVFQPSRTTSVVKWLKAIVSTHLTYVTSNEKCRQSLDKLYDIVKPHEELHVPLLALQGKIDLLQSYVRQNNTHNDTDDLAKSAVVYDDDSEDDTEELWREVGRMNDNGTSDDEDMMGMEDTDDNIDATTGTSDGDEATTGTDADEDGGACEQSGEESEGD